MLACISVFLGVQAGMTLYVYKDWRSRVKRWTAWGVLTGVIAAGLCGASQDGGVIPVNKNLWWASVWHTLSLQDAKQIHYIY